MTYNLFMIHTVTQDTCGKKSFSLKYIFLPLSSNNNLLSSSVPKNFLPHPYQKKKEKKKQKAEVQVPLAPSSPTVPSVPLSAAIPLPGPAISNGVGCDAVQGLPGQEVEWSSEPCLEASGRLPSPERVLN